ncbi:hypothetical protein BCR33DRAFT_728709 [Rhizoclosmatium globosum]|uniref:Uncharacterized protein n=1 Tax=Rhizoclosmatium globosum TaxID=329046 RepID=A0A1Y2AJ20_9FUNG|nr:hypothetical protein BCR33DRAFT_728709 [Rhizoclosmatium globosum]|eukprot:ORY22526.1 hypothetical protein BCR33DRAFT_728709 [Rhizoclosmatium globosum]
MNPVHQRDDAVKVSLRCSVPTPSTASANKLKRSFTYANIHSRKSAGDTAYPRFLWSAISPNSFTSSSRNIQRTIEGDGESIDGLPSKSTLMREREGGALMMRLCCFLPPPTHHHTSPSTVQILPTSLHRFVFDGFKRSHPLGQHRPFGVA